MPETIFVHYGRACPVSVSCNIYNSLTVNELSLTLLWSESCCISCTEMGVLARPRLSREMRPPYENLWT
jgi:hypothetical protein